MATFAKTAGHQHRITPMRDYKLDSEISQFLQDSERIYPVDAVELSMEEHRKHYSALCDAYQAPIPDSIFSTDHEIPGRNGPIPIRIYENHEHRSPVTIMYLHGGGFILGGLDSHHSICAEIAERTDFKVVAVDYRLAPEHIYPVQFEDALDAFLSIDTGHTVVVGDSAGGTLAAALCVAQRGSDRQPVGQVLIYPSLGGQYLNLDSYQSNHDAPALSTNDVYKYMNLWTGNSPPEHDPIFAPLMLSDFSDLPPCIAIAAQHDPLRDDVVAWSDRLNQAGVSASHHVEDGLIHGYLRARHCSDKAARSFSRICRGVKELGDPFLDQN
jgi:acetyl esterase